MIPPFDIQGGAFVALSRDATVTALLSVFGTILFHVRVAPRAFTRAVPGMVHSLDRRLRLLALLSAGAGVLAALAWLLAQSADLADAATLPAAGRAVPTVLLHTAFGRVIAGQAAALLGVTLALGNRWPRTGLILSAIALGLQAGHGHAASMYEGPSLLLAADILHLAGAGAWLGGLMPLMMVVATAPPPVGAAAARWFSPLGKISVAALVVSAIAQAWVLVASIPGLVGTAYGWMILVKLALFGALLGFAAANRYRLAPALLGQTPQAARRRLITSIGLQTGFALAIVAAAMGLSELPPPMHLQPLWPFAQRLSLDAVREDPDFRREVILAAAALAGAMAVLAACLLRRRFRLAALGGTAVAAWFAIPHFGLLLADATPTSFYRSTTGFSADSIDQGRTLYARNCVACHGAGGAGDGPLGKTMAIPPADLTATHLWMHSDGELFWWLTDGMYAPDGRRVMPGFARLAEDERWALIDYIRAHNAGLTLGANGEWSTPVQAPDLALDCDGETTHLSALRGQILRLALRPAVVAQPLAGHGCTAQDSSASAAYAIVAPGAGAVLIDAQGWLRAAAGDASALRPGTARPPLRHPPPAAMPMDMKM